MDTAGVVYGVCVREWFSAALKVEGSTRRSGGLHGHDYLVEVCVESEDLDKGFVVDHYLLRSLLRSCIEPLDHRLLNDVVEPPTTENIATYVMKCVNGALAESEVAGRRVRMVRVCTGDMLCGYVVTPRS